MRTLLILGTTLLATGAVAQQQRAPAKIAPAAFPPGPGQVQVKAACSACHAVSTVTSKRYSAAKWDQVVDQMVSRGAPVKDADYDVVVAYLAKNFGVKK